MEITVQSLSVSLMEPVIKWYKRCDSEIRNKGKEKGVLGCK